MAKKRSKAVPMVMKEATVAYRRRLLERWGYVCIVCGHEFANLACVTKEHIVPRSAPNHMKPRENVAPSHYRCNKLRGTTSIVTTAQLIDGIEKNMHPSQFIAWLNRAVPHLDVPQYALLPIRQPRFMELPEHLPGMSQ